MSHFFFFQAEDGIRDVAVTGVQTCALPISMIAALRLISRSPSFMSTFFICDWLRPGIIESTCSSGPILRSCVIRSEERRVGKECRSRLAADHCEKRADDAPVSHGRQVPPDG